MHKMPQDTHTHTHIHTHTHTHIYIYIYIVSQELTYYSFAKVAHQSTYFALLCIEHFFSLVA